MLRPPEFEADKASLLRMLHDFETDYNRARGLGTASTQPLSLPHGQGGMAQHAAGAGADHDHDALAGGMAQLMVAYEEQLKSPLRNLVAGQLARSLLIQVGGMVGGMVGGVVGGVVGEVGAVGMTGQLARSPLVQVLGGVGVGGAV